LYPHAGGARKEQPVADGAVGIQGSAGDGGTFTREQVDEMVKEALADAKASNDAAFQSLWSEAKAAKAKAKAFDGMDAQEVREKLGRLSELEHETKAKKAGITKEQMDQMRRDIRDELEREYTPHREKAESLNKKVRELQLDNVVKGLMGKSGVRPERIDTLFRVASDKFDLTDDGSPMLRDNPGRDVGKFIAEELGKEYPEFFQGSGSSGGGAPRSTGGAVGGVRSISADDGSAFISNLEGIARGTVVVR